MVTVEERESTVSFAKTVWAKTRQGSKNNKMTITLNSLISGSIGAKIRVWPKLHVQVRDQVIIILFQLICVVFFPKIIPYNIFVTLESGDDIRDLDLVDL